MNKSIPFDLLADIELPNEPTWHTEIIFSIIALSLLLILLAWKVIKRKPTVLSKRATTNAQQVLNDVIAQHQATNIDQREAAFRIATVLRLSLSLPQLTSQAPDGLQHEQILWHKTIQQLEQLRYQHHCDAQLSPELMQAVRRWIQYGVAR